MGLFKGAFEKVKSGLAKTRSQSTNTLRSVLLGQNLSPELIKQIEKVLIQADVGVKTAVELRKDIQAGYERGEMKSGDEAFAFLKDQLAAYFPEEDRRLHLAPEGEKPTVILVCGVNGAGKTTSIAKMAKSLRDEGRTVLLGACDTFRAAAVEQLEVWSRRLGIEVIKGKQGGDPAAVAYDATEAAIARGVDVLILDTAGRLHTQDHLMRQLTKIREVVGKVIRKQSPDRAPREEGEDQTDQTDLPAEFAHVPHEVILVIDATTGQNGINQAKVFAQATNVTGLFLAKLDGSARGGIVIAIRETLNLPVKFIGVGETLDDVEPFDPTRFVEAMFAE